MGINNSRMFSLIILLLSACFLKAETVALFGNTSPITVDLGRIYTFNRIRHSLNLLNNSKETYTINEIKADCSCIKTITVKNNSIMSGQETPLTFDMDLDQQGAFQKSILIKPQNDRRHNPVLVQIIGEAKIPLSIKAGWKDSEKTNIPFGKPANIGVVYKKRACLVVLLEAQNDYEFGQSSPVLESELFEMSNWKILPVQQVLNGQGNFIQKEQLLVELELKKLIIGRQREIVKISLNDNTQLQIPISFRVSDNIYLSDDHVSFNDFNESFETTLSINFEDSEKPWETLTWNSKGVLASAVSVFPLPYEMDDDKVRFVIHVNQSKLKDLPKGYVFCRLSFFYSTPSDPNTQSVLLDGWN